MIHRPTLLAALLALASFAAATTDLPPADTPPDQRALALTQTIQARFLNPDLNTYHATFPQRRRDQQHAFMWDNVVQLTVLTQAARHDPNAWTPILDRFFTALNDHYWDTSRQPGGYQPTFFHPDNPDDRYYDDNAWAAIDFVYAHDATGDPKYLQKAREIFTFLEQSWDNDAGGGLPGGHYWHVARNTDPEKAIKPTCTAAPTAYAALLLAQRSPEPEKARYLEHANRTIAWLRQNLQDQDALYFDAYNTHTRSIVTRKWTYNTAMVIRCHLLRHQLTNDPDDLAEALRIARVADAFLDPQTNAYRDPFFFSHLLVEADLELYLQTRDPHFLTRARNTTEHYWTSWTTPDAQPRAARELKTIAGAARALWLIQSLAEDPGELTLHVATDGNDAWSGRLQSPNPDRSDGPLASLAGARDRIRQLKSAAPLTQPITVLVADGTYQIPGPIVFTPEDSGRPDAPITYRARPGAAPVISGARPLPAFTATPDGLWQTRLPENQRHWRFDQLFINNRRAARARTPNQFYHYMGETTESPLPDQQTHERSTRIPPELTAQLAQLSPDQLNNVVLTAFHKWSITKRYLRRLDPANNLLITHGPAFPNYTNWPPDTRFTLENYLPALDQPGEWCLTPDATLYYKPLPDQHLESTQALAPVTSYLLLLEGQSEQNRFVEHLRFQGLAFQHAAWPLDPAGYAPYQAAFAVPAAIVLDGARHVHFDNCQLTHLGNYAIWFRHGCHDCSLTHSLLEDLGAGGVRIGEPHIRPEGPQRTHHITIDNNIIRAGGRIYTSAVGLWLDHSPDNTITHNDISDFYYTGLSLGWSWGYGQSLAKRNLVAFNRVHHIGQAVLSDLGGIYTLGLSEGTHVHHNVFHDIHSYDYGGWGLYTDEGSSGILMENNLVYNTKTGSFHQHYGRENTIRNNILAFSQLHQLQATRPEPHLSFRFHNNIVYFDSGQLLAGRWRECNVEMDRNCYWKTPDGQLDFAGLDLAAWQNLGRDPNSIVADPLFLDPANADFRLQPDSPALQLGFQPFDTSTAGVYGHPHWQQRARDYQYQPLNYPPKPD